MGALALPWKVALGGATAVIVALAFFLFSAQMENRHLVKVNHQLDERITNPATGLTAQLAQATTNVATLRAAVDRQNASIRASAATSDARLAELTARLAATERERDQLRATAAQLLRTPPNGNTLEEQVLDVDRRLLETLK